MIALKDADGIGSSADHDQTAPLGLFQNQSDLGQAYLSKSLGKL